jgi:histidinol-phosphate/aromatic aminotransferase/cobyric acid decarboxylase-like protein
MKDLTGKKGIEGSQYIRVAVRNSEDNDSFIEAIQTI